MRAHLPLEAEKIQQVARASRRKGVRHSRYPACEASTHSGHPATRALSTLSASLSSHSPDSTAPQAIELWKAVASLSEAQRQPRRNGAMQTIAGLRAVAGKSSRAHVAAPEQ